MTLVRGFRTTGIEVDGPAQGSDGHFSISLPTERQNGDQLIVAIHLTDPVSLSTPAGWTVRSPYGGYNASPDARPWVFTKTSDGAEGSSLTFVSDVTNYTWIAAIAAAFGEIGPVVDAFHTASVITRNSTSWNDDRFPDTTGGQTQVWMSAFWPERNEDLLLDPNPRPTSPGWTRVAYSSFLLTGEFIRDTVEMHYRIGPTDQNQVTTDVLTGFEWQAGVLYDPGIAPGHWAWTT